MEQAKKTKILGIIVQIKGIILTLLGILHIIVTYFEYELIKDGMPKEIAYKYSLWFYGVGLFILFMGLVDLFSYKGIKQKSNKARQISLLGSIFNTVLGLSGLITFKWALGPPWLLLICGIIGIFFSLLLKKEFVKE